MPQAPDPASFQLPAPPPPIPRPSPIAFTAHTIAFLFLLLLTTFYSHLRASPAIMEATPHITRFVTSMIYEWLLLGAVIAGIFDRRAFFNAALFSRTPSLALTLVQGAGVYCIGLFAIITVGAALAATPLRAMHNDAVLHAMLPQTLPQLAVWFLVSLTAGVCEELIFRGYLLQQLTAWTGRPILSILLAGFIFGSIHLYEGAAAILPIAALGIVYGFVVLYTRGDLRAVIIAHTLQDFLTAVFAYARPYAQHHEHSMQAITQNISSLAAFFS